MAHQNNNNPLTDNELIHEILNSHKPELYAILYRRYVQKVNEKCYTLLKDKSLAAEFTQDIFYKVWEKLPGFKGDSKFSTWLYAVTYNYCIEFLRNKKKMSYPEWSRSHPVYEEGFELEEDETELKLERLKDIFELLHPEERALLMMRYMDNMSIAFIQQTLKISESAAKMRLKRAKERVVQLYNKKFK
jgi:RNA polymerase sigma factor (sigma-70 family)